MANTQPHNTTFSKVTATEFKFPMNWSHGRACNLLNSTNPTKCSMYTPNVFMPIDLEYFGPNALDIHPPQYQQNQYRCNE